MMVVREKLVTTEEFWEFVSRPENRDKFFELVEGIIIEMSPANMLPSAVALRIAYFIMAYLMENDIGFLTGADGGYNMSEHDTFAPDVAYISKARLPQMPEHGFTPLPPDLAVEVVSPSDAPRKVREKATSYISLGTSIVWVVFPQQKTVEVYKLVGEGNMNVETLDIAGVLSGNDILPGFSLAVEDIFPA